MEWEQQLKDAGYPSQEADLDHHRHLDGWLVPNTADLFRAISTYPNIRSVSVFFDPTDGIRPWEARATTRIKIDEISSTGDEYRENGVSLDEALGLLLRHLWSPTH